MILDFGRRARGTGSALSPDTRRIRPITPNHRRPATGRETRAGGTVIGTVCQQRVQATIARHHLRLAEALAIAITHGEQYGHRSHCCYKGFRPVHHEPSLIVGAVGSAGSISNSNTPANMAASGFHLMSSRP